MGVGCRMCMGLGTVDGRTCPVCLGRDTSAVPQQMTSPQRVVHDTTLAAAAGQGLQPSAWRQALKREIREQLTKGTAPDVIAGALVDRGTPEDDLRAVFGELAQEAGIENGSPVANEGSLSEPEITEPEITPYQERASLFQDSRIQAMPDLAGQKLLPPPPRRNTPRDLLGQGAVKHLNYFAAALTNNKWTEGQLRELAMRTVSRVAVGALLYDAQCDRVALLNFIADMFSLRQRPVEKIYTFKGEKKKKPVPAGAPNPESALREHAHAQAPASQVAS